MKLGVFTTLLSNLPFEEALKYFKSLGIEAVEIGCGGFGKRCRSVSCRIHSGKRGGICQAHELPRLGAWHV